MSDFDHHRLDEVFHSRLRLAIVAALIPSNELDFVALRDLVGATDGNMYTHLKKLEDAGYLEVRKEFLERKPCTWYRLTEGGRAAFVVYVEALGSFIKH